MKKKAICTIMIVMLFVTPCYRAYADAGTIAITGGSIAVGGAGTIATGAIAGPVVVAVFCGMMAMGMNVSLTNASQEAGMTKTQFLKSKLEQYCNEAQVTYGVFNNAILNGTTVLKNGAIKLGSQAGTQIKQFCNWLFNTNQVNEPINPDPSGGGEVTLGNYTLPVANSLIGSDAYNTWHYEANKNVGLFFTPNDIYVNVGMISNEPFTVNWGYQAGVNQFTTNATLINGYYVFRNTSWMQSASIYPGYQNIPIINNFNSWINGLDGSFDTNMDTPVVNDGFTGERDTYNDRSGALDVNPGQSTVINPGLIGNFPIPADTDVTVNIRDYLDALQKVLDGIQDGIVARDKDTDIPITIPIPDETVVDPTIDKEDDQDLPDQDDQTPVTDPDKPVNPEQNPNTAVEPLKFDLKNIFPFCIPFDIKDMLAKLNADPVAPNYHVDWNIPLLHTSLEFDINLSCWNSVAAILRKMELLSFIVGLAVLTRNLIRG